MTIITILYHIISSTSVSVFLVSFSVFSLCLCQLSLFLLRHPFCCFYLSFLISLGWPSLLIRLLLLLPIVLLSCISWPSSTQRQNAEMLTTNTRVSVVYVHWNNNWKANGADHFSRLASDTMNITNNIQHASTWAHFCLSNFQICCK